MSENPAGAIPNLFPPRRVAAGTIAPTWGEQKEGMHICHKGIWGYSPLIISLANTKEVLYVVDRSGNAPSDQGAAEWIDGWCGAVPIAGWYMGASRLMLRGGRVFLPSRRFVPFLGGFVALRIKRVILMERLPPLDIMSIGTESEFPAIVLYHNAFYRISPTYLAMCWNRDMRFVGTFPWDSDITFV
jgi:hypothetical protein